MKSERDKINGGITCENSSYLKIHASKRLRNYFTCNVKNQWEILTRFNKFIDEENHWNFQLNFFIKMFHFSIKHETIFHPLSPFWISLTIFFCKMFAHSWHYCKYQRFVMYVLHIFIQPGKVVVCRKHFLYYCWCFSLYFIWCSLVIMPCLHKWKSENESVNHNCKYHWVKKCKGGDDNMWHLLLEA